MDSAQKTKHTWRQNLCMCLICTDNTNCVCLLTRIGTDSGQNRPRISVQTAVQLAHWFFACSVYSCPTGTLVFRLLCIQLSNWHIGISLALYTAVQLAHWYFVCSVQLYTQQCPTGPLVLHLFFNCCLIPSSRINHHGLFWSKYS